MRYFILFLLGLIVGGIATFYFFVGAPRIKGALAHTAAVQAPDAKGDPPGTAVLTLDEKFFDTLLDTVFRELHPPTFRLAAAPPVNQTGAQFITTEGGCANQVTVAREGNGARTGVELQNGQINAPIVFSGTYSMGNCLNFSGTARANVELRYKADEQMLLAQINVVGVNIENIPPMFKLIAEPVVTTFVQNAINERGNPVTIMRGQPLVLNVPVQAAGGTLRAQAKDVHAEIKDGALRLHITYDFHGAAGATAQPTPQS
jgi:hypothetical protein